MVRFFLPIFLVQITGDATAKSSDETLSSDETFSPSPTRTRATPGEGKAVSCRRFPIEAGSPRRPHPAEFRLRLRNADEPGAPNCAAVLSPAVYLHRLGCPHHVFLSRSPLTVDLVAEFTAPAGCYEHISTNIRRPYHPPRSPFLTLS
jgi:hypothetical protein